MPHPISDLTDLGREMHQELASGCRSAVRFPVHLPVLLMAEGQQYKARTENFSSNGALFCMSEHLPAGSSIQFLVQIPADLTGADATAAILGEGQVIRSYQQNGQNYSAIVIHEYRFQ